MGAAQVRRSHTWLMSKLLAMTLMAIIALTGCSSGSTQNSAADASGSAGTASSTPVPTPDLTAQHEAFVNCLRDQGIEFRDDHTAATGQATSYDPETIKKALLTCIAKVPQLAEQALAALSTADRQKLSDVVGCLRDAGFDLPSPDFSSVSDLLRTYSDISLDLSDPRLHAAAATCAQKVGWDWPTGWPTTTAAPTGAN